MIGRRYASRYHDTYRGTEKLCLTTRNDGKKLIVSEKPEERDN